MTHVETLCPACHASLVEPRTFCPICGGGLLPVDGATAQLPERVIVPTGDGSTIRLTHYRGDPRWPVILAPGLGVAALSYAAPTVERHLVSVLQQSGHDVWLLDYRASPALVDLVRPFTLDEIADYDWPAAVSHVVQQTGSKVQILAHCVSALALMMGVVDGAVPTPLVRSIICSSVAAHPVVSRMIRVKMWSHLLDVLLAAGVVNLTAAFNPRSWTNRLLNQMLRLYPSAEQCASPVCRRILFLFHDSFRHEHLNAATHAAIPGWFGAAHLPALKHVGRMIQAGQLVRANGQGRLPFGWQERVKLPITLMGGRLNQLFLPASLARTHDWLLSSGNDPALYRRQEFSNYGHMDCFIGTQAHEDIFGWIANEFARVHIARRTRGGGTEGAAR